MVEFESLSNWITLGDRLALFQNPHKGKIRYCSKNFYCICYFSQQLLFSFLCSSFLAAGLSVRSIFKLGQYRQIGEIKAYIQKLKWTDGSGSDLVAILNAYRVSWRFIMLSSY